MHCSNAARWDTVYQEDESRSLVSLLQEGYKCAEDGRPVGEQCMQIWPAGSEQPTDTSESSCVTS
jgi:hypothetical protein